MRSHSKLVLVLISIVAVLLTVSFVEAQDATQPAGPPPASEAVTEAATEAVTLAPGSPAQLKLKRPLLGMQLMDLSDAPNFYQELTSGGGDLYIAIGGTCVSGYTGALASLGMVWVGNSGPVEIGFNATDPAVPTATILWDQIRQQWWCNHDFSQGNALPFQNIPQGIYFVWVLTQTSQTVQGSVFVRAAASK